MDLDRPAVNEYLINSFVVEVTAESAIIICIDVSKNIKVAQPSSLAQRKGGAEAGIPCGFGRETNETKATNSNRIDMATTHVEGIDGGFSLYSYRG
jgi:hypothetical protein